MRVLAAIILGLLAMIGVFTAGSFVICLVAVFARRGGDQILLLGGVASVLAALYVGYRVIVNVLRGHSDNDRNRSRQLVPNMTRVDEEFNEQENSDDSEAPRPGAFDASKD